jgi:hypothetical protein
MIDEGDFVPTGFARVKIRVAHRRKDTSGFFSKWKDYDDRSLASLIG